MNNFNSNVRITLLTCLIVFAGLLAACDRAVSGESEQAASATATPEAASPVNTVEETAGEPLVIESGGEVPFYARFGESETFSDGEWAVIVFYRPPDCIPADFNLNQFFHFPDESSPGAFACTPPTTTGIETWQSGPETDPAPLVAETTGRGAVPVWFFTQVEIEEALSDGVVTIGELAGLPSRLEGSATTYEEYLRPSQSNEQSVVQFTAKGTLSDGGTFSVDVSMGAPDVSDHVTVELPD